MDTELLQFVEDVVAELHATSHPYSKDYTFCASPFCSRMSILMDTVKKDTTDVEPKQFFQAMMDKFHQKTKEGLSATPWRNYDGGFLLGVLREEIIELNSAINDDNNVQEECVDVANTLMFYWIYLFEKASLLK